MRIVIDTNVLISALLFEKSLPAHLITLWRDNWFKIVTSEEQIIEFRRVSRYPKVQRRILPSVSGTLVNDLWTAGIVIGKLPDISVCSDPHDDFLLAMAEAGTADYLITGDKRDLLVLKRHKGTRILSVADFLTLIKSHPEGAKSAPDINP